MFLGAFEGSSSKADKDGRDDGNLRPRPLA